MERIAILAGGGRLPLLLADSIASKGGRAHIVAVRGEAGPEVEAYPHTWVTWGSINAILATLKRESNATMIIAGSVKRPDLKNLKPDFGLIRYLPSVLSMLKGGDDAVLTRLVRFFEGHGLAVKGVGDVAPQLLAEAGPLTGPAAAADGRVEQDVALGFRVLDALADLDVGQAIAVEAGRILAIEGVEGTDRMLARIADLPNRASMRGVLVKGPKRGQDLRVDLPTVGAQTISKLVEAKLATLVIVAGKTLLLERAEMQRLATESEIAILCVDRSEGQPVQPSSTQSKPIVGRMLGRWAPKQSDARDAQTAVEVGRRLRSYGVGDAAVVVRDHVLAVSAAEGAAAMARRVAALRQWGRKKSGRGAAAIRLDALARLEDLTDIVLALDGAGLAGIAIVRPSVDFGAQIPVAAVTAADRLKLFLIDIVADGGTTTTGVP